jgi:hypothetical protein
VHFVAAVVVVVVVAAVAVIVGVAVVVAVPQHINCNDLSSAVGVWLF